MADLADLADYLGLTEQEARDQFSALVRRRPAAAGRQVTFLPVETLLCLAASFLVNHRHYGGSTAHQAPPMRDTLLLPPGAQQPARKYLDWHRGNIFDRAGSLGS